MKRENFPDSIYVAARYSKRKTRFLLRSGFKIEEMAFNRCSNCTCKVVMHIDSELEGRQTNFPLVCGDCAKKWSEQQTQENPSRPVIMIKSSNAERIQQRFFLNLRKN